MTTKLIYKELGKAKNYYLIRFNYVSYSIATTKLDDMVADSLYKYYVSHGTTKRVNLKLIDHTNFYTPVMFMKNRFKHTQILISEENYIKVLAFYSRVTLDKTFEELLKHFPKN